MKKLLIVFMLIVGVSVSANDCKWTSEASDMIKSKLQLPQGMEECNDALYLLEETKIYQNAKDLVISYSGNESLTEEEFLLSSYFTLANEILSTYPKFAEIKWVLATLTVKDLNAALILYREKMDAYLEKLSFVTTKRALAMRGDNPSAVQDYSLNGYLYRQQLKATMEAWIQQGYKNSIETLAAKLIQEEKKYNSLD